MPADLDVVWLLWRDGQDYDEGDELLVVSRDRGKLQDILDRFKSESYRYSISCAEIDNLDTIMGYLEGINRG